MATKNRKTKTTTRTTTAKRTASKKATKRKSTKKTTASKKATTRKSAEKTTASKKAAKRRSAKKTTSSARTKSTKKTATRTTAPKKATKRKSTKKATSTRSRSETSGGRSKGTCSKRSCGKTSLDGRSLVDRAKECQDLEQCRRFILELGEAIEQSETWLHDMHDQALSAEQARDLYGEQISDLLEAIDLDRARISELESELANARRRGSKSSSVDTVLRKLGELRTEIQAIRSDLRRLLQGRPPSAERRRRARTKTATKDKTKPKATKEGTDSRLASSKEVGPFAKYSVLRGAACSLGVGKYGYPPEVCAPASFPRSVAAEILGTYAQNDYGGLAKWALITGLPIDDGGSPPRIIEATVAQDVPRRSRYKAGAGRRTKTSRGRTKASGSRKKAAKAAAKSSASTTPGTPTRSSKGTEQILDKVLLTIARI